MNIKCSKLALICLLPLTASAATQVNQLTAIGNNQFTDSQGFVDTFTCPSGGTPLVIYSTAANNQSPIESADKIVPAFIAPGFKASELNIPQIQQTNIKSNKYLTLKTRNPAELFVQFDLNRYDQQTFEVNSVQFPVPYLKNEQKAMKNKFVTQAFIKLDNQTASPSMSIPVRDHSFEQDYRLEAMGKAKHLAGYFASWSQNGKWGGAADQRFSNIPYIFSAIQSADDPNFYNGYGVCVCGQAE